MKFYYAVFAFSMSIVFYACGWFLFLGENTGHSIFQFEKIKYFSFSMILIAVIMTFSYRNKKRILQKIKKEDAGFTNCDILVAAYITMALCWFFYNVFQIG